MATKIEWTEETWNPMTGCSKVSPGCRGCYAEKMARRLKAMGQPNYTNGFEPTCHPHVLDKPLRWRKPRRVFVCSMSDLFHPKFTDEQIAAVFGVMAVAAQHFYGAKVGGPQNGPHTFQVLTKRADRMARLVGSSAFRFKVGRAAYGWAHDRTDAGWLYQCITGDREPGNHCTLDKMWPLPNVMLGVSVEDQQRADERIPLLLQTPAAVRFVSCEPLLGPISIRDYLVDCRSCDDEGRTAGAVIAGDCTCGRATLDWVIAGAESGPGARPASDDWFRSLRDQCHGAGVGYFLKQMVVDGKLTKMPALDGRRWAQLPGQGG